jgi:CrcB protein
MAPETSRAMPLRTLTLTRFRRPWITVLAGGLIGSAARTGVGYLLPAARGRMPVATLIVNLTGSLLLGFYLARREQTVTAPLSLQFWGIGVFGSFTTFSTFSIEVVHLLERGQAATAVGYIATSIIGGLILALSGQRLGSVIR